MSTGGGARFEVRAAEPAAAQLKEWRARALVKPRSAAGKLWKSVREVLDDWLTDPELALAHKHALTDDLKNVFRIAFGARMRLFYLVSSRRRRVVVLLIGYRKDGDKNDAYEVLRRRIKAGEFDAIFEELGVEKPKL